MKGFGFDFELEGGNGDEHLFTIAFNATPFVPARTNCSVENSHPAEGGDIEDLAIFHQEEVKGKPPILREVPEFLWSALGFDRKNLIETCEEHVRLESERQTADEGDRRYEEARDR